MKKLKILVVTHKNYIFPNDEFYYPIQVGKENSSLSLNILADNQGENISSKNGSFCELTALYWAWKNCFFDSSDFVGLVHYRRYFKGDKLTLNSSSISSGRELLEELKSVDCIVPKKRNYYIETVYSHYKNAHFIDDLEHTKNIIHEKYPEYLDDFSKVMNVRTLHLYNMFIMNRENTEKYCSWLFDILFELEKRIDTTNYDRYQQRVLGFIAERLFNVWLIHNKIVVKELGVINLDGEKWLAKVLTFLKRKFIGFFNVR